MSPEASSQGSSVSSGKPMSSDKANTQITLPTPPRRTGSDSKSRASEAVRAIAGRAKSKNGETKAHRSKRGSSAAKNHMTIALRARIETIEAKTAKLLRNLP